MVAKSIVTCLLLASQTYYVPPAMLAGIYKAEGGKIGQEVKNDNGTYDLGPMQINTIWIPVLAKKWHISEKQARKQVRDNTCTNMAVAAWILRNHINETKNLSKSLTHYHSRTPKYGRAYYNRVMSIMKDSGLIKTER